MSGVEPLLPHKSPRALKFLATPLRHTGCDVIIYFRSEVIAKKLTKIPPTTASGRISRERFKLVPRNASHLSRTIGATNMLEMTSIAASGRHLSRFETRPKMPHPTALLALSITLCQRRLQISQVKNIGNVLD